MELSERPRIKLTLTTVDKVFEILSVFFLVCFWIFTFRNYAVLPEVIPIHFRANGTADGYGGKWTLFLSTIIATVSYIALTVLSRYPHKFNYTTPITPTNALQQYTIMTRMIRVLKLSVILIFFAIEYKTVQTSLEQGEGLGGWFMFMVMSLIFVPLFYFLIQLSKNS